MGATLELAFIGSFSVGASIPPDVVTGGILGTAFAITAGAGTETALLLGLPIATLTLILKNVYLGLLIPIMNHRADRYAEDGNYKGVEHMHLLAGFGLSLMLGLVVMISYLVGSQTIGNLLAKIPDFVQNGLTVATGLIPALGFAMLARLLIKKSSTLFLFRLCCSSLLRDSSNRYCHLWGDLSRHCRQYHERTSSIRSNFSRGGRRG